MALPEGLMRGLRLPAVAAPMFLISGPDLVVEVCRSGLLGTFPALNQRDSKGLESWLDEIEGRLGRLPNAAPFGVNLIVHKSNSRLAADLDIVVKHKVPLVITSLGAAREVVDAVHSYGGAVFHDVINRRHAEKAAAAGVDGIIAVCAGAGGHAGALSPLALVGEITEFFNGTIVLAGAISTGEQIAAARVLGADLAYLGTRFIASRESLAVQAYKQMLVSSRAADILYTERISGVCANFLRPSIVNAGLDPDDLPERDGLDMQGEARAWKTIWSAGHGVGAISDIPDVADICERLIAGYHKAMYSAGRDQFARLTSTGATDDQR